MQNYDYRNYYSPSSPPQLRQYAFVNGIEGAKSFQLAPNQTIMLMDSDNPICYMKTSNGIGQSTLRYFKLTEVSENELKSSPPEPKQEYVLKADFDELCQKFNDLTKKLESAGGKDE